MVSHRRPRREQNQDKRTSQRPAIHTHLRIALWPSKRRPFGRFSSGIRDRRYLIINIPWPPGRFGEVLVPKPHLDGGCILPQQISPDFSPGIRNGGATRPLSCLPEVFHRPPAPTGCAGRMAGFGVRELAPALSTADLSAVWSFYIRRAHYLRIPLPSPPWGRGWIASGAFISRGETGEGVRSRASYRTPPVADHTASKIFPQMVPAPP